MELTSSLQLVLPEIVLSLSALGLLMVAAWAGDRSARSINILSCVALGAAFFMVMPSVMAGVSGSGVEAFYGQFTADAFTSFAKLLIFAASGAVLVMAPRYFDRSGGQRAEFAVLVLLATAGMSIMVSANDLLTLYIGLELNSLSAYVLASILRDDDKSAEAGLKYFVLGALASGILLFGMSLTYGFAGSTSFEAIATAVEGDLSTGALFGLTFVITGLAFKMSAVPFHMWTPDVYEGSPTPVTAFFASAPKVAAIALTSRVLLDVFGAQIDAWRQIVIFAALASIIVGALGAIGQNSLKRLLAYSSINNVGFVLIGVAAGSVAGASAVLVYLTIYVAMTIGTFAFVMMLRDADGNYVEKISDLAGLSTTRPGMAWCMLALMFSIAGIPPLFGFFGKFVVFQAAVEADLVALAAIGIAASVIGAFYYLKIVKVMFFDKPANVVEGEAGVENWVLLVLATLFISPLGYFASTCITMLSDGAAAALLP